MKLEISISAVSFKPTAPQGAPNVQVRRVLEAMARTVIATPEELAHKRLRTLDKRSCQGIVALAMNENVGGSQDKYKNDRIMFFGDNLYGRVIHVLAANDYATTIDNSFGEFRWSPNHDLQFWSHELKGLQGDLAPMDLLYYISVKDFYEQYVLPALHYKLT